MVICTTILLYEYKRVNEKGVSCRNGGVDCWMLDAGYWILDTGYWMFDSARSKNF
jgi:hypothetical protein